ncbi:autophagy-related protein 101-like [Paramacrobiotus metropolitanus]|uniref:autophagy-related protein 101-like n=1 Tax=Paramacrobiotus metropolitanus TaxID=2943436 RepID=UPI0024464479|nr:autophagy-related protein 101-like [Paramacrobiotus metropolitanus]
MNARRHVIDLTCDARQVEDSVSALFHTILFHRCLGKFTFREDANGHQTIVIGTVGYDDVDCSAVDLTYVRCSSPDLTQAVSREVVPFARDLQNEPGVSSAAISLEFFEKRPRAGLAVMGHDKLPWEIWVLKFQLANSPTESERRRYRYELAPVLADKMLMVVECMNRYEYVPKNPQREELGLVFDTNYSDVQPYLFQVKRNAVDLKPSQSVSKSMGRFLRDALEI